MVGKTGLAGLNFLGDVRRGVGKKQTHSMQKIKNWSNRTRAAVVAGLASLSTLPARAAFEDDVDAKIIILDGIKDSVAAFCLGLIVIGLGIYLFKRFAK